MSWEIYDTPEYIKFMSSSAFMKKNNDINLQGDMLYFVNWVLDNLDTTSNDKLKQGMFIKFDINEEHYDKDRIIRFARQYIRTCEDPISKTCVYEVELTKGMKNKMAKLGFTSTSGHEPVELIDMKKDIANELFKFFLVNTAEEKAYSIALRITVIHVANQARVNDTNKVTMEVIASTIE